MADEEIARETKADRNLLDAQWQKQQIKSFTAWVNSHLGKAGMPVEDLEGGFKDGLKLIKLVEVISGEKLRKPEKGRMRIHHLQNVNIALDAIAAKGVRLVGISAEEIVDQNLKLILGMVWMLILRFQIEDISVEEMSAKEGLLLWCQRKTAGYAGCNVQNFHISFQDGNAFCALIHRHRPDLLDYNALHAADAKTRLETAFQVAEQHLGIPQMLDANDMLETLRPDERSVMTYVAAYYHAFAGMNKSEEAARRVEAVLAMDREFQELRAEYETRASDLLEWIVAKRAEMGDLTPHGSLAAAQGSLQAFRSYKKSEKPPKSEERAQLEAHYATLQTKLRLNNRPAYHPEEGLLVSNINNEWKQLEVEEKAREEFIRADIDRLERLEQLVRRFNAKADFHEKWSEGKLAIASSQDYGNNLPSVQALLRQFKAFRGDVKAHNTRPTQLRDLADQLQRDGYEHSADVDARVRDIETEYQAIIDTSSDRKARLEENLALQERLDNMRLDFAGKAQAFVSWAEAVQEDLVEDVRVRNAAALAEAEAAHAAFKGSLGEKQAEVDALLTLASELEEAGVADMVYTQHTAESIHNMWVEIQGLAAARDQQLLDEQAKEAERAQLRREYASVANEFGAVLEKTTQDIRDRNLDLGLEEQLQDMQGRQAEVHALDASEVHEVGARCEAEGISSNAEAQYTVEEIDVLQEHLNTLCTKTINTIENQILMRDQSGISEEKMKEYRDSFDFFDKNHSGHLDRLEFRSCLLSIGYDLPDVKGKDGDPAMDKIMAQVDPDASGYVTYEAFVDFVTRDRQDSTSAAQFVESFKTIAGDKDYITEDEIRRDLSPATADFVMSVIQPYPGVEGGYDYNSLSASIFA